MPETLLGFRSSLAWSPSPGLPLFQQGGLEKFHSIPQTQLPRPGMGMKTTTEAVENI